MSQSTESRILTEKELSRLEVFRPGPVDLRRDLYWFVRYVQDHGLTRTFRENMIPKTDARRLAKLLSYEGERDSVEGQGSGHWSNHVSYVALRLGLVTFATKGEYQGYSSTSESFPDNQVTVKEKPWREYLSRTPLEKERLLVNDLLDHAESEFFAGPTLIAGGHFDTFGCATGPASRMKLPKIRRGLLSILAKLKPERWYDTGVFLDLVREQAPHLILDPATRHPDRESHGRVRQWEYESKYGKAKKSSPKPPVVLEDIYENFRERNPKEPWGSKKKEIQIDSSMPDAFSRVEGRYLEWFLREAPYLLGFVGLAYRPKGDLHGLEMEPPLGRLKAFSLAPKFFQVMGSDPEVDRVRVTVLPNFEVIVEAVSYPETVICDLERYTTLISEDGPIHRLKIDRKRVMETVAADARAPAAATVLERLTGVPLPQNVSVELLSWTGRAEKVTIYQGLGLLEFEAKDERRSKIVEELGPLVAEQGGEGFLIVRDPGRAFQILDEKLHVPLLVSHSDSSLGRGVGQASVHPVLAKIPARANDPKAGKAPSAPESVRIEAEDLVGYRCSNTKLLSLLKKALEGQVETVLLVEDDGLLILSASGLPRFRSALGKLSDRYHVES